MGDAEQDWNILESLTPEVLQSLDVQQGSLTDRLESLAQEIQQLKAAAQEEAKQCIEELVDGDCGYQEEKREIEERVAGVVSQERALEKQLHDLNQATSQVTDSCAELQQHLKNLKKEREKLLTEKERLEHDSTVEVPKKKYEFSLYSHITKARWDFESDKQKGYIRTNTDVKPFCFDQEKCSNFFIVNSLWDMLPDDW